MLILTNKAKSDLKEIGRYTQDHWGRDQRDKYLTMLDACFQRLAANPLKGNDCSDIRSGYRKFIVGRHVIFYRQKSTDTIEVIRVLHSRMDADMRLSGP
jgi:toxin ParE1/3/4